MAFTQGQGLQENNINQKRRTPKVNGQKKTFSAVKSNVNESESEESKSEEEEEQVSISISQKVKHVDKRPTSEDKYYQEHSLKS